MKPIFTSPWPCFRIEIVSIISLFLTVSVCMDLFICLSVVFISLSVRVFLSLYLNMSPHIIYFSMSTAIITLWVNITVYIRRHYQRYLKAMGINKEVAPPSGRQSATPTKSSIETLAAAAVAAAAAGGAEGGDSSNYSSLLDIGQAYGIWAPGEENSNDLQGPRDLKIVEDEAEDTEDNNSNTAMHEDNDNREDQVNDCYFFVWIIFYHSNSFLLF